jgi:hypothetical protein
MTKTGPLSKKAKSKRSKPFKYPFGRPLSVIRKNFLTKQVDKEGKTYLGLETLTVRVY